MNISIMCSNIQIIYENNRSQLENCKNKFSDKTGTLYSILVKNGYVKKLLLLFFEIWSKMNIQVHVHVICKSPIRVKRFKKFDNIIVYVCLYVIIFVCKHWKGISILILYEVYICMKYVLILSIEVWMLSFLIQRVTCIYI